MFSQDCVSRTYHWHNNISIYYSLRLPVHEITLSIIVYICTSKNVYGRCPLYNHNHTSFFLVVLLPWQGHLLQ